MTKDFLRDLNPAQLEAVKFIEGPELVLAGAGSGKTKVLTYRVAYLVSAGVSLHNILCLTFTNKAANEMRTRINKMLGIEETNKRTFNTWIGTFHSLFGKILRVESKNIGYGQNFSIYDEDDSLKKVREILKERNLAEEVYAPAAIRSRISKLKNAVILPSQFEQTAKSRLDEVTADIYTTYEDRLKKNNSMDFDDLLIKPILLFNRNRESLERYQDRFRFILVDEYQDTNRAQYVLLKLLSEKHRNLCVVGDDAQSIYSWRGAELQNILDFQSDYPDCKVFRLEQNYRSTGKILKAANSLIVHNKRKLDKELWTENLDGDNLTVIEAESDRDEGYKIVQKIRNESVKEKLQLKDFVVLFRTNYQSRALEEAFNRGGIPYLIIGGLAFYKRKEIKDLLAYLRLVVNQLDDESFMRVVNSPPRGVGDVTIDYLRNFATESNIALFNAADRVDEIPEIQPRQKGQLKLFSELIKKYVRLKDELSVSELTRSMTDELQFIRLLKDEGTPEARNRMENIQEFLAGIAEFQSDNPQGTLQDFLSEVTLVADVDRWDTQRNAVTLMTVHAAKGLEFPVVFVSGLEEGLFPLPAKEQNELEEERRLFYVAITRAKRKVYLSHARERYRFGKLSYQTQSRFLSEIESDLLELERSSRQAPQHTLWEDTNIVTSLTPSLDYLDSPLAKESDRQTEIKERRSIPKLRIGSIVRHEFFGEGKVIEVSGKGDNERVIVLFGANQKKQLMLRYANLTLVR